MILGIHHLNIVVSDLKKAGDFFRLFGFSVKNEKVLKGEWLEKVTGLKNIDAAYCAMQHENSPITLELLQYYHPQGETDPRMAAPNQIGYRHLALEVDDIESEVGRLKKEGIRFYSDIMTNPWGKKMCYFTGPDGILLEILEL